MIIVISPAKTLDFKCNKSKIKLSIPTFISDANKLVSNIKTKSIGDLVELMNISNDLAHLNYHRYLFWNDMPTETILCPAILAFRGEVFRGIDVDTFSDNDFETANHYLRILSGMYGLLMPTDGIQEYRLEMGTKLANNKGNDLYKFWGNKITNALNNELNKRTDKTLINLASNEYFKSINKKLLNARIITPVFKEYKAGKYKTIAVYAKKARGLMCRFIIQNKLKNAEELHAFNVNGYAFNPELSKQNEWVFTRFSE